MNNFFYVLLPSMVLATSTFSGPSLIVDTVVTDTDAKGKDKVLGRFHILTEDGGHVVMPTGERIYGITLNLQTDGTVALAQTMIHPDHPNGSTSLGPYQQSTALGEPSEISFGSVTYSTKVTKAK